MEDLNPDDFERIRPTDLGNPHPEIIRAVPELYRIIKDLFRSGQTRLPGEINIEQKANMERSGITLWSALSLLHYLGLINVDRLGVARATSRQAHFILGSFSKFLEANRQVVDNPDLDILESEYLGSLTKSLELIRYDKFKGDREPLHQRAFINVILKGIQIRKFRKIDVFLHIYHPKWNAYHLLGAGLKPAQSINELVTRVLLKNLSLKEHQYHVSSRNIIREFSEEYISDSLNVLCKYQINVRAVESISGKLDLLNLIKNNKGLNDRTFRWFSLDEINSRLGKRGENIMYSSLLVLRKLDIFKLPISISRAEHNNKIIGERTPIADRFLWIHLLIIFGGFVGFYFGATYLMEVMQIKEPLFEIVVGLSTILSAIYIVIRD